MEEVDVQSHSPVSIEVKDEDHFDFPEAMRVVINGDKVRRDDWPEEAFGHLKDGFLMINTTGKEDRQWLVSESDMVATDYILI